MSNKLQSIHGPAPLFSDPEPQPELQPCSGDWSVTSTRPGGGVVLLCYKGQPMVESKGPIAYQTACEMAAFFDSRKYIPKIPAGYCLADLSPAKRLEACLPVRDDGSRPKGVKPPPIK